MFGLIDRHVEFIRSVLRRNIENPQAKFYIFGSRAKGKFREYSDVDIAIDCAGEKLPREVMYKVCSEFENSTFPYEVDVVDLNGIKDDFKQLIVKDLTAI